MVRSLLLAGLRPPLALATAGLKPPLALATAGLRPPLALAERAALVGLDALLASQLAAEAMRRVVVSDVVERAVGEAFEGPLADAVTRRLLESEELWLLVQEVAQSPAVTDAITRQGLSFAGEVAGEVREQSEHADAWLERAARRVLRRGSPAGPLPAAPPGLGPA
jgi:hypothetical protein